MSIYLIRHGETAANASRVVQLPETPLSPRGLRQARLLAQRVAGSGIERILASDLTRASQTAECLSHATGVPVELEALLQERNFGAHRGQAYADLEVDLFGPAYEPPAGESWEAFNQRVDHAWRRIGEVAADCRGHLAVVTHGLVCHSLVVRHLEVDSEPRHRSREEVLRFGNTALTVVEASAPWRVDLLSCTAHLDDQSRDSGAMSGL